MLNYPELIGHHRYQAPEKFSLRRASANKNDQAIDDEEALKLTSAYKLDSSITYRLKLLLLFIFLLFFFF